MMLGDSSQARRNFLVLELTPGSESDSFHLDDRKIC